MHTISETQLFGNWMFRRQANGWREVYTQLVPLESQYWSLDRWFQGDHLRRRLVPQFTWRSKLNEFCLKKKDKGHVHKNSDVYCTPHFDLAWSPLIMQFSATLSLQHSSIQLFTSVPCSSVNVTDQDSCCISVLCRQPHWPPCWMSCLGLIRPYFR
jgi:hypothetical protein